jgi:NAD(P)-dependent dehydrogenase (short-subunit alcohol dehydrogenase family)
MEGKAGIVTGAGTGIGRASALAFAEEGAKVVVSDINKAEGEKTVDLIKAAGSEAYFFQCNVTDEAQVKALIDFAVAQFGRLDWAHNNAGVINVLTPLVDIPTEDWDRVIKTNLYGCFFAMKYEIPAMLESGGGAIVNTGSNVGVVSITSNAAYGASKFAITGLTQCAALDYAKLGIRVNSIGPGATATPMLGDSLDTEIKKAIIAGIPNARLGQPEDQANAAVFLCSDKASHITAVHLVVDGGQFAALAI